MILGPFIKKKYFDQGIQSFRRKHIWNEKTNEFLSNNQKELDRLYHAYSTKLKKGDLQSCFTLKGAL